MSRLLFAALLASIACAPRSLRREPPPLLDEGELFVFVQPFPEQASRLSLALASAAAAGAGADAPLELALRALSASEIRHQRLLAHGRLPPGQYRALVLGVSAASISGNDGSSALHVAPEPYRLPVSFTIARGGGTVLWLTVRLPDSVQASYAFEEAMATVHVPPRTVPQLVAYCATAGANLLTVFDRRERLVTGVQPTGRGPSSVALEADGKRAYVALQLEDAIEVVDVASGAVLQRIRLRGGDGPRELALAGDGRTLLVLNERSNSVAFVDTLTSAEVARVSVGEEPWSLVMDGSRRRAFVLSRRAGSLAVVDVATRAVARTLATDAAPVRGAIDRRDGRLYVVFEGTPYLSVYALPTLALEQRLHVGLGASFVKVDPRTDLVYVARSDEPRIQVFDPISLVALDAFEIPAPASYMAIDDAENVLFLVMPSRGGIAAVDLTSRRTLAILDAGPDPSALALAGERH